MGILRAVQHRARAAAAARREEAARLADGRTADSSGWPRRARAMLAARGGTVARDLARWQQQARPAAAEPPRDTALSRAQHGEQERAGTSAPPGYPSAIPTRSALRRRKTRSHEALGRGDPGRRRHQPGPDVDQAPAASC